MHTTHNLIEALEVVIFQEIVESVVEFSNMTMDHPGKRTDDNISEGPTKTNMNAWLSASLGLKIIEDINYVW